MARERVISVRMTELEATTLRRRARSKGMNVSDYVRYLAENEPLSTFEYYPNTSNYSIPSNRTTFSDPSISEQQMLFTMTEGEYELRFDHGASSNTTNPIVVNSLDVNYEAND